MVLIGPMGTEIKPATHMLYIYFNLNIKYCVGCTVLGLMSVPRDPIRIELSKQSTVGYMYMYVGLYRLQCRPMCVPAMIENTESVPIGFLD